MYRLTNSFPFLLARAGVRMGELFSAELRGIGLTLQMYRVLAALWERDGQRLSELADMIGSEISTLSRMIGAMRRRDLVSRERKTGDERSVRIALSAKGRKLVKSLIPRAQHYEALAVQGFTAAEVAALKQALQKILGSLSRPAAGRSRGTRRRH